MSCPCPECTYEGPEACPGAPSGDTYCAWCGEASETDICATCQRRYEEETA